MLHIKISRRSLELLGFDGSNISAHKAVKTAEEQESWGLISSTELRAIKDALRIYLID